MKTMKLCPKCGKALAPDALLGLCPECMMKAGLETEAQAARAPRPATPAFAVADVAKHFPQLEILELLGQGGMGVVFKARQPQLDRLVALKIMLPEFAKDPAFAERFTREARALARLNHPNIVAVYDFGQTLTPALSHPMGEGGASATGEGGFFYFIMEYVDGANLREMLHGGHLTSEQAFTIVPKICDALQFAHDEGIMHRDIKPENILIDKKGRVKIADFGLAKILGQETAGETITVTGMGMGTPRYMAPEQIENAKAVDHRADIYSLGVVFYEMLTGELPLGRFAPPSQKVQVDVRLDEVVLHTLEKEPGRRYQHASEVKTAVEQISSAAHAPIPPLVPSVGAPVEDAGTAAVRRQVSGPAIGLVVTAVLNWVVLVPLVVVFMYWVSRHESDVLVPNYLKFVPLLLGVILMAGSGLILWGALKMRRLESLGLARMASILSMIVGPGYLVGWPVGIWSLVVLARPEVKGAFNRRREQAQQRGVVPPSPKAATPSAQPANWLGHLSLWTAIGGVVLVFLLALVASLLANVTEGFFLLCWALGALLEVVALGCGIVARRTTAGKAGIIISSILLLLYIAVYLAVFAIKLAPSSSASSGPVESHGPAAESQPAKVTGIAPAQSSVSTNQTRPPLSADQIRVEDTALRLLAAMRDKEDKVLRELATDSITKGWGKALPHFSFELREKFEHEFGKPMALWPAESLLEGDFAVVRCTSKETETKLNGWYLGLIFYKTKDGTWRNAGLAGATADLSLTRFLAEFKSNNIPASAGPK